MVVNKPSVRYDEDFNGWIEETIALLKAKRFEEIDVDNLIDELESMSKRDKREILSRLKVLLLHLLKWKYQPSHRSASWEITIRNNREEIAQILQDSPSLRSYPSEVLVQAYDSARKNAASETGLAIASISEQCPFTIADILSESFLPNPTASNGM
ncbi:DUF29 domain-containing protein [Egbenema bharatensis]|uniref:DUF29 domain-containing protein n=1 Tax=Egbenema bharatensis TaxID=3463334 RepID=UPI003A86250C